MARKRGREGVQLATTGGLHPTSVFSIGSFSCKFLSLICAFASARKFDLVSGNGALEQEHDRISVELQIYFEREVIAGDLSVLDLDIALRSGHRAGQLIAIR